ncbi:MAG: hypothetical protein ABIH11_05605 [Candidatus Altiarchaeota archaeon]
MKHRGQLSTEYLVILAVVVVIALIVVTVLGGFIDIGSGAGSKASKAYWRGADIGILNWRMSSTGDSRFTLRNNMDYSIKMDSMTVEGNQVSGAVDKIIEPGATINVNGDMTALCVKAGDTYSVGIVFQFDDKDHSIDDLTFKGLKKLEGSCEE